MMHSMLRWRVAAGLGAVLGVGLGATPVAAQGIRITGTTWLQSIDLRPLRQDSVLAAEAAAQRVALDTIRRQLGQLLAGQCVKERDRMARVLYGCEGR
jgi:hypothetical protein